LLGRDKRRRGQERAQKRTENGYEVLKIFMFNNLQTGSKSLELDVIICAPIFLVNPAKIIITLFHLSVRGIPNWLIACKALIKAIYTLMLILRKDLIICQ
jgi:hypothetical protein